MSPAPEWNDLLQVKRHHQTSCYQIRNCQGEDEARVDGLPQGSGAQYDHTNCDISQQRSDDNDDVNYGKCHHSWWDIKIVNGWRGSRVNRIFWLIHGKKEPLFLARPAKIENVGDITGCDNYNYIISSVMHAFWLVLTYDQLEDRRIDDVVIKTFFNSLLYKTNRFQVAVRLFSKRTSKCGKNISDTLGCA